MRRPAARPFLTLIVVVLASLLARNPVLGDIPANLDIAARVHVAIEGQPAETGDYTVDPNGDITLLHGTPIHVEGLTIDQAKQAIAQSLGPQSRTPKITISVESPGGIEVIVAGAVGAPGPHNVRSTASLNDVMLVSAPTLDADLDAVQVTHSTPGQPHTVTKVDFGSYLVGRVDTGNPPMIDGDVVFVPRKKGVPITIMVRGQVANSGRFTLPGASTLIDAIAQAGDLSPSADKSDIVVQHSGTMVQTTVDYAGALGAPADPARNPELLDGDIVIVKPVDNPNTCTIAGAVKHPGEFDLTTSTITLADILSQAGGPADHARLDKTVIARTDDHGKLAKVAVDARTPATQKATLIKPGDSIYIPIGAPKTHINPLDVLGTVLVITHP